MNVIIFLALYFVQSVLLIYFYEYCWSLDWSICDKMGNHTIVFHVFSHDRIHTYFKTANCLTNFTRYYNRYILSSWNSVVKQSKSIFSLLIIYLIGVACSSCNICIVSDLRLSKIRLWPGSDFSQILTSERFGPFNFSVWNCTDLMNYMKRNMEVLGGW